MKTAWLRLDLFSQSCLVLCELQCERGGEMNRLWSLVKNTLIPKEVLYLSALPTRPLRRGRPLKQVIIYLSVGFNFKVGTFPIFSQKFSSPL